MSERQADHHRHSNPMKRDGGRPGGHSGGRAGKLRPGPRRGAPRDPYAAVLYGWHTVKAALENPQRRFHRILATEAAIRRLTEDSVPFPIAPTPAHPEDIAAAAGASVVHQGLYAEADALESPELEDVVGGGIVLALDQVTDPHNFGAILRSAAAFCVKAVVTTERHSPQASGALAKAASGALEYVPVVTVVNLARALDELRDLNTLLVGLDSGGDADLAAMPLAAPLALVIGAEGKGLRHLTRARCDVIARLAMPGRITSLNVSNATAVALYVASARLASAQVS
jgi:23S rRNA (guanosine2251-2'-O)-methyltransferase